MKKFSRVSLPRPLPRQLAAFYLFALESHQLARDSAGCGRKKKEEKKRTRTSISRTRGKLYYLDAQLTKKKKEERKGQIISTFKLQSWKGTALVSTLVLENCLSVLNSGRHLRKVGRKISFSPLSTMIYFYSNFSLPV